MDFFLDSIHSLFDPFSFQNILSTQNYSLSILSLSGLISWQEILVDQEMKVKFFLVSSRYTFVSSILWFSFSLSVYPSSSSLSLFFSVPVSLLTSWQQNLCCCFRFTLGLHENISSFRHPETCGVFYSSLRSPFLPFLFSPLRREEWERRK